MTRNGAAWDARRREPRFGARHDEHGLKPGEARLDLAIVRIVDRRAIDDDRVGVDSSARARWTSRSTRLARPSASAGCCPRRSRPLLWRLARAAGTSRVHRRGPRAIALPRRPGRRVRQVPAALPALPPREPAVGRPAAPLVRPQRSPACEQTRRLTHNPQTFDARHPRKHDGRAALRPPSQVALYGRALLRAL